MKFAVLDLTPMPSQLMYHLNCLMLARFTARAGRVAPVNTALASGGGSLTGLARLHDTTAAQQPDRMARRK